MRATLLTLTLLLASASARADVIVVDGAGGGDFTTLSQAVAAAADGDTILIREGTYLEPSPVIIDNKSLTVAGEWALSAFTLTTVVRPGLVVRNLAPSKSVVIQNLVLRGRDSTATAVPERALVLVSNASHVRLQSCWIMGGHGASNAFPDGAPALEATNSASNALVDCYLFGGNGQFSPSLGVVAGNGGLGIKWDGGQLLVYGGSVLGGRGGGNLPGGWAQGGRGGDGMHLGMGSLLLAAANIWGGDGGTSHFGGDGGSGLGVFGGLLVWGLGGSLLRGGEGGGSDVGPNGFDGADLVDPAGVVTDFGGSQHTFNMTSPVRENGEGSLRLGGDSSDATLIFVSPALHQLPFSGYQGVLMLMPSLLVGPIFISPPGDATIPFSVPDMGPGFEALNVHVQPAYSGPDGVVLGPGRVLTVLSDGF